MRLPPPLLACCALFAGACSQPAPRPTVILITLDTTRADHLSTYGYSRPTDPFLASLAARGRVFERAVPTATWTLPSHASMFTGLVPIEHGAWAQADPNDPQDTVRPAISLTTPLFTERLAAAGYHLIGASGGPFTASKYGFGRSFDRYIETGSDPFLSGRELNTALERAIDERPKDKPLFLFVNYFDAHAPYAPPDRASWPFPAGVGNLAPVDAPAPHDPDRPPPSRDDLERMITQYDRGILVQDEALRELFAKLSSEGLLADALVIITADHGEAFGEHDSWGHGVLPFDALTHVPLVVLRTPNGPHDRIVPAVSLTAIPATVLAALDLAALPHQDGTDLMAETLQPPLSTYSEHHFHDDWVGTLQNARYLYGRPAAGEVSSAKELLIDRQRGPELLVPTDLTPEELTAALALRARFTELVAGWIAPPEDAHVTELSPEKERQLEALGY